MDLKWGNEAKNLTPAVFAILSDDEPLPIPTGSTMQPTADLPYYKSLDWFWNCLEIASKGVHSFDILPWQGSACIPWREEIVFNIGETIDVKNGLKIISKNRLQKYTITHLAHAALSMVLVADNPPKKGKYPAYALSLLMINIPLHIFFSNTHALLPMDDFLLKKVMEVTQGCHAKHKDLPAKLSYMAQVSEIFGAALKRDSMAGRTISDPQSFWFVNDGVGENEMDTLYTLDDQKTTIKIEEAFTSVNRCQAAPAFRISSWGNKISISADFNLDMISVAKVIALLTAWKDFMMLIA
ncbi:hypothetical protein C8R41DRAFT_926158 [Lentinula lateritia]|uniref:Uncharacterized protein n=1 Tax=Lentinula lateritia TaxID=40482 RepID=A0ABQ8V046_9AGAR|nr:hypothetical protein C8R41DRAFT_926158 [Lentinula lateritia]